MLVVEDDPDLRQMMVVLLTLEGFLAEPASDGLHALELLRASARQPHVILLDMMMPRMDGWEFCRIRQSDELLKAIPLIVLSAAPTASLRVDAEAIISKPFDYDGLLAEIRKHC